MKLANQSHLTQESGYIYVKETIWLNDTVTEYIEIVKPHIYPFSASDNLQKVT